jgi:hypothetical protein
LKNKDNVDLIAVPKNLRKRVIPLYHDSLTAGHVGFDKKFAAINNRFYWPKMKTEIFDYCESCEMCQKMKSKRSHRSPLISIKVEEPWELLGIDVAGPLKETKFGNKYIILAVDSFSKYLIAKAT